MASKKPYLTSDDLINSVKNTISVPLTQVTFTNQNILDFSTEELFLSQVPAIMIHHEEYFVTSKVVTLKNNTSRYDIPNRAIGMKLRDLYYKDTNGNLFEMVNVGPSNKEIFQNNSSGYQQPRNFYVEGNEIVLMPEVKDNITGSLVMSYYLRPNSLVENNKAAVSNSLVKIITVNNATLIAGDTITIGDNILTAGTSFAIGATSTATATNLTTAISSLSGFSSTVSSNDVSVFYQDLDTIFSTSRSTAFVIDTQIGLRCDSIPEDFIDGIKVDILQTDGGHNTLAMDILMGQGTVSSDTLFFDSLPAKFIVGDYVCMQYECIIPQIPNDLHMLLAQRTCARVLDSLGDAQGSQAAMVKINDLETRQATILDNRTEGSTRKILNKNSLLRFGKSRRMRRF